MFRKQLMYLRTAQHMRPKQLYYYAVRRLLPPRVVSTSISPSLRDVQSTKPPCFIAGVNVSDSVFRFLNAEVQIGNRNDSIDWSASSQPELWRYNLHYFDYLRERGRLSENKDWLIQSWIDKNPQGIKPGWQPFPTSRRIVNWIFYFLSRTPGDIPSGWMNSVYLQTLWLERNDEKHILANHYFENLKALFFAGCFFDGSDADRWLQRAQLDIQDQLREQILSDGGHFERSPQYHCLMLENVLDIFNLSKSNPELVCDEFVEQVRTAACRSLEWLAATLFPDGTIPLFNDSAFGVSVPPDTLFDYAERLSLNFSPEETESLQMIDRPDSGLYGCRACKDMFIIDCGDIGPSYQPGHTHCDFLSYELMLDNQRVIVDTGVCEYKPGPMRNYVRSTRAHNTISVDGREQSEIWGEFRVARRAKKVAAEILMNGNELNFQGSYKGFFGIRGLIDHQRRVDLCISRGRDRIQSLVINDSISGRGHHTVESFVHLHPDITPQASQCRKISLLRNGSRIATIRYSDGQEYRFDTTTYCPEFGQQIPNSTVVFKTQGKLPLSIGYELQLDRQN